MNQKKTPKRPSKKTRNNSNQKSRAVREYTAGGIIFRRAQNGLEFLLIQDLKNRWTIAKGHVESGETLEQTAVREIAEETGLTKLNIIDKLDKLHFFYRMKGKLIFMTNFVFLIESTDLNEQLVPEESEGIIDVRWFDEATARAMIEYKATKVLFDSAIRKIRELDPKEVKSV